MIGAFPSLDRSRWRRQRPGRGGRPAPARRGHHLAEVGGARLDLLPGGPDVALHVGLPQLAVVEGLHGHLQQAVDVKRERHLEPVVPLLLGLRQDDRQLADQVVVERDRALTLEDQHVDLGGAAAVGEAVLGLLAGDPAVLGQDRHHLGTVPPVGHDAEGVAGDVLQDQRTLGGLRHQGRPVVDRDVRPEVHVARPELPGHHAGAPGDDLVRADVAAHVGQRKHSPTRAQPRGFPAGW